MKLKLDRPLVFFDLETTGINLMQDRIVELSVVKIFPDGHREVKTRRLNPGMHIPEEASAVHGIYDEDVAGEPSFEEIAPMLLNYFADSDLGGYNINKFDIPMLINEFKRVSMEFPLDGRRIIDSYIIFCRKEPRSLTAAYKFYCGKDIENAHSAEADTLATVEVFMGQLEKYDDLPDNPQELHNLFNQRDPSWIDSTGKFKWNGKEPVVGFGKNTGLLLRQIAVENPSFLQWMIRADFPDDAKQIARDAIGGKFPRKEVDNGQQNDD